jgi:membrane-associated phospholipid phosphatase
MSIQFGAEEPAGYLARVVKIASTWAAQLVRSPSHARSAEAAGRLARHALLAFVVAGVLIVTLMIWFDTWEITLMPPRGTGSLWPLRILTDFGKDSCVLAVLAVLLLFVLLVAPVRRKPAQTWLLDLGLGLQFVLLSVAAPLAVGEVLKWAVGRGRPFVGGPANAFNFEHFAGTGAYSSFPSAHCITAFALAFAVSALWPRIRGLMIAYALVIAATRLVLLAHHPSDVVAGATIGIIGAMCVRYWFAARGLVFAIGENGVISRDAEARLKGVAAGPSAP